MTPRTFHRLAQAWAIAICVIATILLLSDLSFSQGISTKAINPKFNLKITLSQGSKTTILFPSQFYHISCLGIVYKDKDTKGKLVGTVQAWEAPPGNNLPLLELHALTSDLDTFMTVFMDHQLYTFELVTGPHPDISLTLIKGAPSDAPVTKPSETVDANTVVEMRPHYDPQLLADIMDLAKEAPVIKASYPEGYEGYEVRDETQADGVSDDGFIRSTVTRVHKFAKQDAILLEGKVENLTGQPVKFDTLHVTMAVGNALRPLTLLTPTHPIPANKSFAFTAVTVGDIGGGRADIALSNEFRLIVDPGHHPVASQPPDPPQVVSPVLPPAPLLPPKKGLQ